MALMPSRSGGFRPLPDSREVRRPPAHRTKDSSKRPRKQRGRQKSRPLPLKLKRSDWKRKRRRSAMKSPRLRLSLLWSELMLSLQRETIS